MNFEDFYNWLIDRIADRGKAALDEVAQFARDGDAFETQIPSTAALLCWDKEGCEAIVSNAIARPGVKTISSGVTSLIAAAVGAVHRGSMLEFRDNQLNDAISSAISGGQLRKIARAALQDLFQSVD